MIFKRLSHKILAILFSTSVIISGLLIFFKTYPDNFISTIGDACLYSCLKTTSWIEYSIKDLISEIKTSREANDKIESLKNEINVLQEQLVSYQDMKRENDRLSNYCEIRKNNPDMTFLSASVIGNISNENIFIDVGKRDGVSKNDAVLTEDGFVGRVSRVGEFSSNVKTILSPDDNIGAIDSNTGGIGMISGTNELADQNLTKMTRIKYKDSVNKSDVLTTSGFSGLYPKNLKIGTVESIKYDDSSSSYYAIVRSFNKIDEIKNVYVVTNFVGKNLIDH